MTAVDYVRSRGLPDKVADEWFLRIGWDGSLSRMQNRLVIPIFSFSGKLVAVAGRSLDPADHPKYLFSPGYDKSRWVYGAWRELVSVPVIVEGYLDVWALALCGYTAFAVMGSALSNWQLALIAGMSDRAIIYPHQDDDGKEWAAKLRRFGVKPVVPTHPYPVGAPLKSMGDEETADPHWLYVHQREWLVKTLEMCRKKLVSPSLTELLEAERNPRNGIPVP